MPWRDSTHTSVISAHDGGRVWHGLFTVFFAAEQSLRDELSQTRRLQQDEENALRKKIDGLQADQTNVIRQLVGQRTRVELAEQAVKRAA